MAKQSSFHVLGTQRLTQQRIRIEVDLTYRKIIGRAPVGVHPFGELQVQWRLHSATPPTPTLAPKYTKRKPG